MAENYFYAREKLWAASEILMTQSGGDRDKIKNAYLYYLFYLDKDKLPVSCHSDFDYLEKTLANESKTPEWDKKENRYGSIEWACRSLNSNSIKKSKQCIWNIFSEVCH